MLTHTPDRELVLRAGGGVFFDTGTQPSLNAFSALGFSSTEHHLAAPVPVTPSQLSFPLTAAAPYTDAAVFAFSPHQRSPYTVEWNIGLERALGKEQSLTLSYVGADGDVCSRNSDETSASQRWTAETSTSSHPDQLRTTSLFKPNSSGLFHTASKRSLPTPGPTQLISDRPIQLSLCSEVTPIWMCATTWKQQQHGAMVFPRTRFSVEDISSMDGVRMHALSQGRDFPSCCSETSSSIHRQESLTTVA